MKDLKFIHITKTAGTTIENLAKANNINWGRFDLDYRYYTKMDKILYIYYKKGRKICKK